MLRVFRGSKDWFRPNPLLVAALTLLVAGVSASATVRYVDVNSANPTPPYTNWTTAATNIQEAIDAAVAGDQILVANGLYQTGGRAVFGTMTNRVAVDKPVALQSANGPQFTIIQGYQVPGTTNGEGAIRCVYLTNGVTLSGFTLTNGATRIGGDFETERSGGGLWCASTTAVVSNCVIAGNSAGFGGGAFTGTLINCTLSGNSADSGGGAARGTLRNCKLTSNHAVFEGGGAAESTLNNCTLTENSSANWGGGVHACTVNNCTLSGNSANTGGGAARGMLTNCIVYYNTAAGDDGNYDAYSTLNYCCTTPLPASGVGNLDLDPQLASASHLSANSPCLGQGTYAAVSGVDLDGEPWADPPAMGCDQYYSGSATGALTVALLASYTNVATGFGVNFRASIAGHGSASRWEFDDGTVVSNRMAAAHTWSVTGDYPVVVRAYNSSYPAGVTATVTVHVVTQPVHYVAWNNAFPATPYTSWGTAATNIQDAVDAASVPGALVLVTNGTYASGGWDVVTIVAEPLELRSVNGPQFTMINGGGTVDCVYLFADGATLSGFTLTNAGGGNGGVWCWLATTVVSNCVVSGNFDFGAVGGTLNNCVLSSNSSGGAYSSTLNNCVLSGNAGGGATESTLNNCTLIGNSTPSFGGGLITAR